MIARRDSNFANFRHCSRLNFAMIFSTSFFMTFQPNKTAKINGNNVATDRLAWGPVVVRLPASKREFVF